MIEYLISAAIKTKFNLKRLNNALFDFNLINEYAFISINGITKQNEIYKGDKIEIAWKETEKLRTIFLKKINETLKPDLLYRFILNFNMNNTVTVIVFYKLNKELLKHEQTEKII